MRSALAFGMGSHGLQLVLNTSRQQHCCVGTEKLRRVKRRRQVVAAALKVRSSEPAVAECVDDTTIASVVGISSDMGRSKSLNVERPTAPKRRMKKVRIGAQVSSESHKRRKVVRNAHKTTSLSRRISRKSASKLQEAQEKDLSPNSKTSKERVPIVPVVPRMKGGSRRLRRDSVLGQLVETGVLTKKQAFSALSRHPRAAEYMPGRKRKDGPTAVETLAAFGMDRRRIARIIVSFPAVLSYHVDSRMRSLVSCLQSVGLSETQIAQLVCKYPPILGLNVANNVQSKLDFFAELGVPRERIGNSMLRSPHVLGLSIAANYKSKVEYFSDLGMSKADLVRLLSNSAYVLGLNLNDCIRAKVEYFCSLGIPRDSVATVIARQGSVLGLAIPQLQARVSFLRCILKGDGLSQEGTSVLSKLPTNPNSADDCEENSKLARLLQTSPQLLAFSVERNMRPKLSFYLNEAKVCSPESAGKLLLSYPTLFNYSLSARLLPRLAYLKKLGLEHRVSMNSLCFKTDAQFASREAGVELADYRTFVAEFAPSSTKTAPNSQQ